MNKPTEFIELRSEEVQEVLTRVPSRLLRWGIMLVFLILGLVFWASWLIHYPDLINASFKLVSINTPKVVLARTDGKLVRLFVKEGQSVLEGTVLAYLESTARHEEVLQLSGQLEKAWALALKNKLENLDQLNLANYHRLGELQNAYQTFEREHIQLRSYLADGFYLKKKILLQQEIADLQALFKILQEQRLIHERDMKLAQEDYEVQQVLAEQKVIAPLELKKEESKNIYRKLPLQQTVSSLINNLSAQRSKQKEILELNMQVAQERDNFLQALNSLQSETEIWKSKYIVLAPVSGKCYFSTSLQENQHLSLNQELLFIAPPTTDYFGDLLIPQQNAGKVQVGQKVLIKFAGYPYHEFGTVSGKITSIAQISIKDSIFRANVEMVSGLKTSYGKKLSYKTGMSATAQIITDDNRLFVKLFYQLRKLTNGS